MMSYVDPEGVPPPEGAARVGAELRHARERLGWTVAQVAESLRIRQPYLAAIEEGRLGELPGNAYAMGFVRTYATALGLDPRRDGAPVPGGGAGRQPQDRADLSGTGAAAWGSCGRRGAGWAVDRGRRLCRLVSVFRQ